MTKNTMTLLVRESYNGDKLDGDKAISIASRLNRNQLKEYINALKDNETKNNVFVTLPYAQNEELFSKLYHGKKIVLNIDPSIMLGVKIEEQDNVYEFNLRNALEKIVNYVSESYE